MRRKPPVLIQPKIVSTHLHRQKTLCIAGMTSRARAVTPFPDPVQKCRHRRRAGGQADGEVQSAGRDISQSECGPGRPAGFPAPGPYAADTLRDPSCWRASRCSGTPLGNPHWGCPDRHPKAAAFLLRAGSSWADGHLNQGPVHAEVIIRQQPLRNGWSWRTRSSKSTMASIECWRFGRPRIRDSLHLAHARRPSDRDVGT